MNIELDAALIKTLTLHTRGQKFKAWDFHALLEPGVYVAVKSGKPLYVGMGKNLLRRLSGLHHKRHVLRGCDEILCYPCRSEEAARKLESLLIRRLHPKFNERGEITAVAKQLGVGVNHMNKLKHKLLPALQ